MNRPDDVAIPVSDLQAALPVVERTLPVTRLEIVRGHPGVSEDHVMHVALRLSFAGGAASRVRPRDLP